MAQFGKGKKEKTKFVIFANWRTGSMVLKELVNCHPAIQCAGEVFNEGRVPQKVLFPCFFLEESFRESQTQAYCVSLKPDQIVSRLINKIYDSNRFLHYIYNKGWKIIHLKRRNVLRKALPDVIANQKSQHLSRSESLASQEKIRIDCNHSLKKTEWMEQISFIEDDLLKQIPHATFFYEDDLLHPERHPGTADKIFNILSLSPVSVRANMVRLSTDDISVFVENYSELEVAVRHSKLAKFLEI